MNKMTFEELIEYIKENNIPIQVLFNSDWEEYFDIEEVNNIKLKLIPLGLIDYFDREIEDTDNFSTVVEITGRVYQIN